MIPFLQSNTGKPSFSVPFRNLGAGIASTPDIAGGAAATFTRATAAASKLATGLWKLDVASGSPRFSFSGASTAVTTAGGYFPEGAATQLALNPRDMTQAAWIAVTMTTAQTSTGIDGVGSSCTRITAAGVNSTILQTLIAAATNRTYSCFVKRVTGTGTVLLKHGTATLDITALINSSTFTRVELPDNELNVAYGIQINTSADALDVDCNQFEPGAVATSPIPAAGSRNQDSLTYPTAGFLNANGGTFYVAMTTSPTLGTAQTFIQIDDGTNNERYFIDLSTTTNARFTVVDGGVTQAQISQSVTAGSMAKVAARYIVNDFAFSANGAAVSTDVSGTLPTVTTMRIGTGVSAGFEANGFIAEVKYFTQPFPNATLQSLVA